MFNKVINKLTESTSLPIRLISNDKVEECLVYNITPINDTGVKRQDRLEIKIIGFDLEKIELEDKKIRQALLSIGDRYDDFNKIELNGGGLFKDPDIGALTKSSFYIMTTKSEVQ